MTDIHGRFSAREDKGSWKNYLTSNFVVITSAAQFVML